MSFLDPITAGGIATDLQTNTATPVNVDQANPPTAGQVLTAVDATHAEWQDPAAGGGGGGGAATDLAIDGEASVNVSNVDVPVAGQVLTAIGPTQAIWAVPGLHYDAAVKFWADSTGSATIQPATWGLVDADPSGPSEIVIDIVSDLSAPPVDSRFGLYVGAAVTLPVRVAVIGASFIMDLDHALGTVATLQPGAMYEWVLYHDGTDAIWGLVSDTAHIARAIATTGGPVSLIGGAAPTAGQVLTALSPTAAAFADPSGGGLSRGPDTTVELGKWSFVTDDITLELPTPTAEGQRCAIYASAPGAAVSVPDGCGVVYLDAISFGSGSTIPLTQYNYCEWYAIEEPIEGSPAWVWLPVSTGTISAGGGGGGGTALAYGGNSNDCVVGQWVDTAGSGAITFPTGVSPGDSFGVYVQKDTTIKSVTLPSSHVLVIGEHRWADEATVRLRNGAYYEWFALDGGEGAIIWTPRASHHTEPAPLARRLPVGPAIAVPNEWAQSSYFSDVVLLPEQPQDGDVYGVYVDGEGATITPRAGQSVQSPDLLDTSTYPATLSVQGTDWYEWMWVDANATWCPRRTVSVLQPRAVTDAIAAATGTDLNVGNKKLTNVTDPENAQDAATKAYVDAGDAATRAIKLPVRTVATVSLTLTGLTSVSSVVLQDGDRVLATAQTLASDNGIWVASAGAWTRPDDFDSSDDIVPSMLVVSQEGNNLAETIWSLSTNGPITLGTTNLAFALVGGAGGTATPQLVGSAVTPQSGTSIRWAPDNHVHGLVSPHYGFSGFRLSTSSTSSVPVDGSYSTIFLTAHAGSRISLFNGSEWIPVTLVSGLSIAITGQTAGIPCDVFVQYASLTAASLVLTPWATANARATALGKVGGVWAKSGSSTQRYVGTILPDSATSFTHRSDGSDSTTAVCGIWNQDNRIRSTFTWQLTAASWSPGSANAWLPIGGIAAPHIEMVTGQAIDNIEAKALASVNPSAAVAAVGIGYDSTSVATSIQAAVSGSTVQLAASAQLSRQPAIGRKTVNMLAYATTTGASYVGTSAPAQSGLTLDVWA